MMIHASRSILVLTLALLVVACVARTAPASELPLESMQVAPLVGKLGAPVEVRYALPSKLAQGEGAALQLAFVPRVAAARMRVEFPANEAVSVDSGDVPLDLRDVEAAKAYRHKLGITPRQPARGEVRVLVTIDVGENRYFGIYSVPLGSRLTR